MNYRHAFHAGNFADLVKHAALLRLLDLLLADVAPLTVVDTHAGAGTYDLTDAAQLRSKEAEAGIARLLDSGSLPPPLASLAKRVRAANHGEAVTTYPGSPTLILDRLRRQDRFVACELLPDDHARLARLLSASEREADARRSDGYAAAVNVAQWTAGRLMILMDPPFELADDYTRIVETVETVLLVKPEAVFLIWLPLKDLETLDAFVRRLERVQGLNATIAETRLRRPHEPMRLNGCVMVAVNAPQGFDADLELISSHVAATLGEPGGGAKTWQAGDDT